MSYLYDDFSWKIIYKVLSREKHLNISVDKDKQNPDNIDEKVVDNILKEKYMNGSHLDILKSMFNMILLHHTEDPSGKEEFNLPYLDSSILNLLSSFKLASLKNTSEGYAMLSNFKSINDMVIIKTSKTKKDNRGILFEYFIGTIGINKLRTLIPNFAYTLAIFKCNPLVMSEDKVIDIKKFCKNDSEDTRFYVVYEKIKGISMNDFVHSMLPGEEDKLLGYIIQIVFALIIAQREIGYVHYDLHTDNIMLRKLPHPKVIEYDIDGKIYRIETDAIPTIIDYGFSHFVCGGIPLGGKTFTDLGIIPTLSSKGFDLYKMIMYTLNGVFNKTGANFFNKLSWILDYYKNDPFGIHNAYKSKNYNNLEYALGVGWKKFYGVTPKSPIYNDHPMNFLKWLSQANKPFWDKSVKVSDSLYNVPSNNIIESYGAKIEGRRIFNSDVIDDINNCEILDTDHRSYVINQYVLDEFTKILNTFGGIYIKDPHILKNKIKLLSDKSERNKNQYIKNDSALLALYTDELIAIQNSIDLEEYERKLSLVTSVLDIKRLDPKMKIIQSYIETYNNYRIFIDYSKISSRLTTDISIDEYKSRALSIYKQYEQIKSEYIFETLRQKLDIIDTYIHHITPSTAFVPSVFTEAIIMVQYIVDDMRLFYPEIEYACVEIEKMVYNIVLNLLKINTFIYVPPRSGIQLNIVSKCSLNGLENVLYDNFKFPDTGVISSFINSISRENLRDNEIYSQLTEKFVRKKPIPDIQRDFEFIINNDKYKNIKMDSNIRWLDVGSPIMETYSREILDILNIPENYLTTIDLSGGVNKRPFVNLVDVNSSGKFPFVNDYFSLVTGFMVIHNISDITDRLSEIHRVMKRGGLFVIREYDSESQCQKILSDIDKILGSQQPINQSFYLSSSELRKIMSESGFAFISERTDTYLTKYSIHMKY